MKCLICGNIIIEKISFTSLFPKRKRLICDDCLNKFTKVTGGCIRCGKKTTDKICCDCLYWEKKLTKIIINYSLYYYNDYAKEVIKKIKFLGDLAPLFSFSSEITHFFRNIRKKNYYLVPVSLHKDRLYERGFNQSKTIAKMINLPILDILVKNNNDRQSKKKKNERIIFDNQYELINKDIDLHGKNIIIIDDIYTTGATIHKVGKVLLSKNVSHLFSFTLFRS